MSSSRKQSTTNVVEPTICARKHIGKVVAINVARQKTAGLYIVWRPTHLRDTMTRRRRTLLGKNPLSPAHNI